MSVKSAEEHVKNMKDQKHFTVEERLQKLEDSIEALKKEVADIRQIAEQGGPRIGSSSD